MALVRMTGLIALSVVATTVQASARPLPAAKPDMPPGQKQPRRDNAPVLTAQQNKIKQDVVLVIGPSTSAWSDPASRRDLDGSGPKPLAADFATVGIRPAFERTRPNELRGVSAVSPPVQGTRSWLVARYPHAPPSEG
jgi:hypothetical protein